MADFYRRRIEAPRKFRYVPLRRLPCARTGLIERVAGTCTSMARAPPSVAPVTMRCKR